MEAFLEKRVGAGLVRPTIPPLLVEATIRAIKEGMKPDEFAMSMASANEDECCNAAAKKLIRNAKYGQFFDSDSDEDEGPPRTYRNFDERRMGVLVTGDQHRFGGKFDYGEYLFPSAPPLDYSFCVINRIEEIVTENEQPQHYRNFKVPEKTPEGRYKTSSLLLSYNVIGDMDGLINVLYTILHGGPMGLCWLDLSFNVLAKLDDEVITQLPNLKILYLHGNDIMDMTEVRKLTALRSLISLTLHGNPVEQEEGYRIAVIHYLPELLHLDFVGVTKGDRANSKAFGEKYEAYWDKRHAILEAELRRQQRAAEVTQTERAMLAAPDVAVGVDKRQEELAESELNRQRKTVDVEQAERESEELDEDDLLDEDELDQLEADNEDSPDTDDDNDEGEMTRKLTT